MWILFIEIPCNLTEPLRTEGLRRSEPRSPHKSHKPARDLQPERRDLRAKTPLHAAQDEQNQSALPQVLIERKPVGQLRHFMTNLHQFPFISAVFERLSDPSRDQPHLRLLHPPRRQSRRPTPDPTRLHRRLL